MILELPDSASVVLRLLGRLILLQRRVQFHCKFSTSFLAFTALDYFDGSKFWHACTVVGKLKSMYNLNAKFQRKVAPDCDLCTTVLEDSAVMR